MGVDFVGRAKARPVESTINASFSPFVLFGLRLPRRVLDQLSDFPAGMGGVHRAAGPANLNGHALRVSHTYAQPLAKRCSNSFNLLLGHWAEYPPERKRSIEEIETLGRRTRQARRDALECRTQAIWGGILWRSNPLTLREIRVVDHICDLPSSPKGAIKADDICRDTRITVG